MQGAFAAGRKQVDRFGRHVDAGLRPLDLATPGTRRDVLARFDRRTEKKGAVGLPSTVRERETPPSPSALGRGIGLGRVGLDERGGLLAFLFHERRPGDWAGIHSSKADRGYRGIGPTLLHRTCVKPAVAGVRTLHHGQDSRLTNPAATKRSYRPAPICSAQGRGRGPARR